MISFVLPFSCPWPITRVERLAFSLCAQFCGKPRVCTGLSGSVSVAAQLGCCRGGSCGEALVLEQRGLRLGSFRKGTLHSARPLHLPTLQNPLVRFHESRCWEVSQGSTEPLGQFLTQVSVGRRPRGQASASVESKGKLPAEVGQRRVSSRGAGGQVGTWGLREPGGVYRC